VNTATHSRPVSQLGDARSGKLAGNLSAFGRTLRRAGVRVDASRIALAQQAVQWAEHWGRERRAVVAQSKASQGELLVEPSAPR
jgi:uncharacterized protein with von Willebrand factor type A (vWA) domain